jgi:hypothetical protein
MAPKSAQMEAHVRIYQGDVWGIETAGWSIESDDTCLTLCPADVDAALQISAYLKRDGSVTSEELLEGARERAPQGTPVKQIVCGPFVGYRCEYANHEEGLIWRVWQLGRGQTELFITYNTSPEHRDKHRAVVDWMLSTLTEGPP